MYLSRSTYNTYHISIVSDRQGTYHISIVNDRQGTYHISIVNDRQGTQLLFEEPIIFQLLKEFSSCYET
jgi:hypothetical protein